MNRRFRFDTTISRRIGQPVLDDRYDCFGLAIIRVIGAFDRPANAVRRRLGALARVFVEKFRFVAPGEGE